MIKMILINARQFDKEIRKTRWSCGWVELESSTTRARCTRKEGKYVALFIIIIIIMSKPGSILLVLDFIETKEGTPCVYCLQGGNTGRGRERESDV